MGKRLTLVMMAVVLVFAAFIILQSESEAGTVDADLIFINDSGAVVGSVGISYSNVTECAINADNSPIRRGEKFYFSDMSWPVVLTVCEDVTGNMVLAEIVVEDAPQEGECWLITLNDDLKLVAKYSEARK